MGNQKQKKNQKAHNHSVTKDQRMRHQIAIEAARLIEEEGVKDFHFAKHKAAERLHAPNTHNLPRNDEIQEALYEYQRLFKGESQPEVLKKLRLTSCKAMRFLHEFQPRLVGAVLDGSASEHSDITLHLFAEPSDSISLFFMDNHINYELESDWLTLANGETEERPMYSVLLDDTPIYLVVFDLIGLRQAPRSAITGKPMPRANLDKVEVLLNEPSS